MIEKRFLGANILEQEQLPERVAKNAPHFEAQLHSLKGQPWLTDIRNYGFAGALQFESYPGEPARRPFELAMRLWDKGFYVRYGGDCLQLGLPFITEREEIDSLVQALSDVMQENA